jgi:hypothetical protein
VEVTATCPHCHRVSLTREERLTPGRDYDPAKCHSAEWGAQTVECSWMEKERTKADAELLALARCLPGGLPVLREVVRVLKHGAERHGCAVDATGGGQGAEDHAAHAFVHAMQADRDVCNRDEATGALDLVHMVCRGWLGAAMVAAGEAGGGEGER